MKVKNIGIYAHVDAGKTTITENLLYETGVIKEIGRVDKGSTLTDNLELERKRGISIQAAPVSFFSNDVKINLVDTPGHADFIAEVEKSMNVLDGAILVISAKEGVQAQTSLIFDSLQKLEIPTIIFINKIDRLGVNLTSVIQEIKEYLSKNCLSIQKANLEKIQVSNLFCYDKNELIDFLCDFSEDLQVKYLEDSLTTDFIENLFRKLSKEALVYPILFGSALKGIGVKELIEAIDLFIPRFNQTEEGTPSGTVFKVKCNKTEKKVYVRLYQGSLKIRDYLNNEKITKLEKLENGKEIQTNELLANDIGIVYGPSLSVNMSFGEVTRKRVRLLEPTLKVEIKPLIPNTRHTLLLALDIISEEDPFLDYEINEISKQIHINIFGDIQLEILKSRLESEFDITVDFESAQTILKETPVDTACSFVRLYDKRYPFFAEIGIKVEPLSINSGIEVISEVSTGGLLQTFQNGIFDGVNNYLNQGLKGWPLTNIRITITHGNYDSVNSTPSDFRNLAPIVLMQALNKAKTQLLWPILKFRLRVPASAIGKALSELSSMNACYDSPKQSDDNCFVHGFIPADTCRGYELEVRSYTEGKGVFSTQFSHYDFAPNALCMTRQKLKVDPLNETIYLMHKRGIYKN